MYAKIFKDVLTSSLTQTQPIEVRGVFFMMLAAAERDGEVKGTDPAIARIMNVPMEIFQKAVAALMAPDPDSATPDMEGRRLVKLEQTPGYRIVNYCKYRDMMNDDERRAYWRFMKQEERARKAGIAQPPSMSDTSSLPVHERDTPKTESAVRTRAAFLDLPPNLSVEVWRKLTARGGKDGNGQVVRNFDAYLKSACEAEAGNVRADKDAETARLMKEIERL